MTEGDIIPKPTLADIPVLATGYSGQTIEWLAAHMDGWMFYAQEANRQREIIKLWRRATGKLNHLYNHWLSTYQRIRWPLQPSTHKSRL